MSILSSIRDELKRSPVAALSGAAGAVIAALSFALAWLHSSAAPPKAPMPVAADSVPTDIVLGNVFLAVAYFLAVTTAASLLLRAVARKHDLAAFFASIPLIALTNFSTILIVYIAPPRALSPQFFASAHDLVFYASVSVVVAICGKAALAEITSTGQSETVDSHGSTANALGSLAIASLVLLLWSGAVFAGQSRLSRTFLPEIAHSTNVQPSKPDA